MPNYISPVNHSYISQNALSDANSILYVTRPPLKSALSAPLIPKQSDNKTVKSGTPSLLNSHDLCKISRKSANSQVNSC